MWNLIKRKRADRSIQHLDKTKRPSVLQQKFVAFMQQQEKKFSITQKKIILFSFCAVILLVHAFNVYKIFHPHSSSNQPTSREGISMPSDITLPDSLDIHLIKKYREMKRSQDSLTLQKIIKKGKS